jgi:thioredoxin-like negative regulator of GroEL
LILLKIDADENPELLQSKGIEGIPYLELYKDGKLVWSYKGFISESEILAQTKL